MAKTHATHLQALTQQRLKALEKDPRTAWRVTEESWARLKTYGKLQEAAGHVLRMTNTPWAPWIVVEGTDDRYRSLTVGKVVLDALQKRLADSRDQGFPVAPPMAPRARPRPPPIKPPSAAMPPPVLSSLKMISGDMP